MLVILNPALARYQSASVLTTSKTGSAGFLRPVPVENLCGQVAKIFITDGLDTFLSPNQQC